MSAVAVAVENIMCLTVVQMVELQQILSQRGLQAQFFIMPMETEYADPAAPQNQPSSPSRVAPGAFPYNNG